MLIMHGIYDIKHNGDDALAFSLSWNSKWCVIQSRQQPTCWPAESVQWAMSKVIMKGVSYLEIKAEKPETG